MFLSNSKSSTPLICILIYCGYHISHAYIKITVYYIEVPYLQFCVEQPTNWLCYILLWTSHIWILTFCNSLKHHCPPTEYINIYISVLNLLHSIPNTTNLVHTVRSYSEYHKSGTHNTSTESLIETLNPTSNWMYCPRFWKPEIWYTQHKHRITFWNTESYIQLNVLSYSENLKSGTHNTSTESTNLVHTVLSYFKCHKSGANSMSYFKCHKSGANSIILF